MRHDGLLQSALCCTLADMSDIDALDLRLLVELDAQPRVSVLELAGRLGVARNTVHHRLSRLDQRGLLRPGGRQAALAVLGFEVTAFVSIAVAQGRFHDVVGGLAVFPQVLECSATTGRDDLVCRVVARSTHDLHELIQRLLHVPGVLHTTTSVAVAEVIPYRLQPLLEHIASGA